MHRTPVRTLAALLALAPALASAQDNPCKQKAAALEAWMSAAFQESSPQVWQSANVVLPRSGEPARRLEPQATLEVTPSAVMLEGAMLSTGPEMAAVSGSEWGRAWAKVDLAGRLRSRCAAADACPGPVTLMAHEKATWGLVRNVLSQLAGAGVQQADVALEGALTVKPPAANAYEKEWLSFLEKSKKAPASQDKADLPVRDHLFDRCPQAKEAASAAASQGPRAADALWPTLPSAIERCHCQVDFDEVRSHYWALLGRYSSRPLAHVSLVLAGAEAKPGPGVLELRAGAAEPWPQVLPRLLEASRLGKALRLELGAAGAKKKK